jgi:hypothetical protein
VTLPTQDQLGRIVAKDGWSYQLTPDDLLWVARSAAYEGGDVASTLWTYAQRIASFRPSSFAAMVRAHSQPVNPIWESLDAPGCVAHPERCLPQRKPDGTMGPDPLVRRRAARTAPWDSLPTKSRVLAWAQARVPNPVPRATDFADDTVSAGFIRRNPQARIVSRIPSSSGRTEQWYLSEGSDSSPHRPSNAWPADFVTIQHEGRVAGPAAGGAGGAIALGLLGLWAAWRWFGVAALALLVGCGGVSAETRTAYAVEQARCLANERAIIAREGTTREQDEADYAAEQARCDAALVAIGGAP